MRLEGVWCGGVQLQKVSTKQDKSCRHERWLKETIKVKNYKKKTYTHVYVYMYTYMYVCDRETDGTLRERPCQKSLLNNFTDCTFNAELKQCGLLFEMLTDFLHGIQTFTHITMIALLILFNFWH